MARPVPRTRGVQRVPVTVKLDPAVERLVRQRLPEVGGNMSELLRRFVVFALVGGDAGPMPYGWKPPDITGAETAPVPDGVWLCPQCGLMFAAPVTCGGLPGDLHPMKVAVRPETVIGQPENEETT